MLVRGHELFSKRLQRGYAGKIPIVPRQCVNGSIPASNGFFYCFAYVGFVLQLYLFEYIHKYKRHISEHANNMDARSAQRVILMAYRSSRCHYRTTDIHGDAKWRRKKQFTATNIFCLIFYFVR